MIQDKLTRFWTEVGVVQRSRGGSDRRQIGDKCQLNPATPNKLKFQQYPPPRPGESRLVLLLLANSVKGAAC